MKNLKSIQSKNVSIILLIVLWLFSSSWCQSQEIVIPKNSIWKYSDSGQDLGTNWYLDSYSDASWLSGPGILGYGGGDEGTVVSYGADSGNKYITTYFRKGFTLSNLQAVNSLIVRLMRDDGGVIYLNGNHLFSSNMTEDPDYQTLALEGVGDDDERTYFEFVLSSKYLLEGENIIAVEIHQSDPGSSDLSFDMELETSETSVKSIRINEVSPNNISYYPDPDFNQFQDWIELYNPQQSSVNIGGYYLTDNLNKPDKWQIPYGTEISANGYLVIVADGLNQGLHTSFGLASKGERLGLFSPEMVLLDSLSYPPMFPNISYGMMPDGESRGFFDEPSPLYENSGGYLSAQPVSAPGFSKDAGFYSSSITIILSSQEPQGVIRYTTDGSDPSQNSARYEAPFTVSESVVVKAKVYVSDVMPSKIVTKSYFINKHHDLPVISIGTNSDYLDDKEIGIYREDRLPERREWERPGTMEFFEPDGSLGFQINIDYRLFGRGAIYFPQKSLAIFPRKTDGYDGLNYELFPGTSVTHFQSFILRSSSDDWRKTMFRDGMQHTLLKGQMDLEYQDYRPAVLYINGEYMGIHNIRDKLNEDYLASHKAADPANIDLLYIDNDFSPPDIEIKSGDDRAYWAMWDFITGNDMSSDENYQIAITLIDIDNYQNYCCVEIITGNRSWLHNRRVWRPRTPDGKFRYMLFDLDYGYIFLSQNILDGLDNKDKIFKALMKNQVFEAGLIQKLATYSNTIFETDRVLGFIDSLGSIIQSEITRHSAKWGHTYSGVFDNLSEWEANVTELRDFTKGRPAEHEKYIQSFLGKPGKSKIEFQVVPSNAGNIFVNSSIITSNSIEVSYYNNLPIKLSTSANPGYSFSGWQGFSSNDSLIFSRGEEWKYNDRGVNLGANWSAAGFDDSGWEVGIGPLGYGEDHIETIISYGGDSDHKHPTYYFRKEFSIDFKSDFEGFSVRLMRDDGAVVYLNGVEQFRVNMPDGGVDYSTYANEKVSGGGETTYYNYSLHLSDIVEGNNTLAIEIHQESATSADVSFDLELVGQVYEGLILDEISMDPTASSTVIARFVQSAESDIIISELFYRPTSSQGSNEAEFIELFNKGTDIVDLSAWSFKKGIEFTFPQGASLEPGEYLLVVNKASRFSNIQTTIYQWTNWSLSNVGEFLTLKNGQNQVMDEVDYGIDTPWPSSISGYSIELDDYYADNSDPAFWSLSLNEGGTPGERNSHGKYSKLRINEFVGLTDDSGYMSGTDWIEIANTGTVPIDIGGLYLSDELMNPLQYRIPDNNPVLTCIEGGGYIVLIADGEADISTLNLSFKLNANEGAVVLSELVGESFRIIDQVTYSYLSEGQSYARSPDGTGSFSNQENPTPGSENCDLSPNIIAPYQIAPGDKFPVIVRVTDQNGEIDRSINAKLTLSFSGGLVSPDKILIRNGVGSVSVTVNTNEDFVILVDGYNYYRKIRVNNSIPKVVLNGPISGKKYLISGIDYLINENLKIEAGAELHVMPGVRLLVDEKISITSNGLLEFAGSFTNPIIVMPKDSSELWGGIEFIYSTSINSFNWAIFTGGGADSTKVRGHSLTQPVLYARETKMSMNNCFLIDNNGKAFYGLQSEIVIDNSVFSRCDMGPDLDYCYSIVKNSWFIDLPDNDRSLIDDDNDGIYFKNVLSDDYPPNILKNCVINGTEDDGLDISHTKVVVSDCIFTRNYEKGISAGWRSNIFIERCLFYDNGVGVSSTFWTPVIIDKSTFNNNRYALFSSYGGGGIVSNSILSDHKKYYANDSTDAWYFEYCLSDSDPDLFGKSNLFGNPGFVNKGAKNFHLSAGSPAINAGNPDTKRDADGTPSDLGMFPYDKRIQQSIVICEIYYNPPASQGPDEKFEFVEIINPGADLIDISGFRLIDGIKYTFPSGTAISPGEIIIVAADAFTYRNLGVQVFKWDPGKLSNGGERIALVDANGHLVDEVAYLDKEPWPKSADGDGFSMELPDAFSDNFLGSNWLASSRWGGTPGELNLIADFSKISLNEIMTMDARDPEELYMDSYVWLELFNDGISSVDLGGCKFSLRDGSEYIIPVGFATETSVPPNGYLVFVFNSNETYGANHIPLIWNALGDVITLSRGTVVQGWSPLTEISTNGTSSWGRYPDGSSSFFSFPYPTPGISNSLASPDLITMKTVMNGEHMPIILWKEDLELAEKTERDAIVQVISGSANFGDSRFPMIEGVGSMVAKVVAQNDFKIEVGEWQDTAGIKVDIGRHIFHIDKVIHFDQVWTPDHDYYIDRDLDLGPDATVTVLPGTRVFLISGATITVSGSLKVLGTRSNPVLFAPQIWEEPWGQIKINPFSGESSFQYAIFIGAGEGDGDGHTDSQAVISSSYADVNMTNCFILDNPGKGIYVDYGTLNLSKSLISRSDAGAEGRNAHLNISDTYFTFLPDENALLEKGEHDAVYSTGINSEGSTSQIVNSVMSYVRDDAIALYDGATMFLRGGNIQYIGDKAAYVTEADLEISYTLIQKSDEGLVAREQAVITADHLTFFQNTTSLYAYTSDAAKGFGEIIIENSIFYGSVNNDVTIADGSSILIDYSLSDKILHAGTGNVFGNPLFTNPYGGDFTLQPGSPAIDAGNPSSPLDDDGSRTDLGAYFGESAPVSFIVINEIMYAPKAEIGGAEFIEIFNSGFMILDIAGYQFSTGVDFEFPQGTVIGAGEYLLVTKQAQVYQGSSFQVFQWDSGELSDSGEEIRLNNTVGEIVDIVYYGNSGAWPVSPDGLGPSLELKAPGRDNSLAGNWQSSYIFGGTPGMKNSSPSQDGVIINEFMARNWTSIEDDTGEYVDWVELYNASDHYVQLNGLFLSKYDNDLLYFKISGSNDDMLLEPGQYLLFWLDDQIDKGSFHANFELSGSGGFIALSKFDGNTVTILDSVSYSALPADISKGRLPDGTGNWIRFDNPTPGKSNNVGNVQISGIYINELLARNSQTYLNDIGEYDDWIEIYNSTNKSIDLGGLYFSDNASNPLKYKLPFGNPELIMEPKSYKMLFPTARPEEGVRHLDFQLAGGGEHVSMSQIYMGETRIIDSVTYPSISTDMAYARMWDGGRVWDRTTSPTPDASNGTSSIRDNELPDKFVSVFPNPVNSRLNVSLTYPEMYNYRIELINILSQEILVLGHADNLPAYRAINLSWSIDELGIKHSSFWLMSLQINDKSYFKKLILIRE